MARSAVTLAALTVVALIGLAPAAHAQLSETGGPVSYSADNLEYADENRQLVLTGDVDVVQGDARLRSDRLTLYFARSAAAAPGQEQGLGSGDIERMVAEGQVYYVRPLQSARGDRAVYEVANDSVTFTGNVVVASEESVIRGETLVLEVGSRRTTIRPGRGERVRGVFVPRRGAQPAQSGGGR